MPRDDDVFADALDVPEAERAAFLARACAGAPEQRARIEALLSGHERPLAFLQAPAVMALPDEKAGDSIGRYRLIAPLGEGGCGVVWQAEQTEPVHRHVALKVIKLGMDTKEVVVRFEAERQALALMNHPNIAKVFDAGATPAGRPFFVMELVQGIPITRFCDERMLAMPQRLELFITVCHAIQHAHQKGIIHRDIKPSNLLVTLRDGAPVPVVIDFGIAKATEGRLTDQTVFTAVEQFIGTPAYMSPEQAGLNGLDVDTRSDVYSLGVLLYELLTGRPPFDPQALVARGIDGVRRIVREVDPPRPSTRVSTLSEGERSTLAQRRRVTPTQFSVLIKGDLDWIVMRCLEKNPTRRYEAASTLAADLRHYLQHEPVSARPPSRIYLAQKLVRRHRVAFASVSGIAAALLLGLVASAWQAFRATRAERRAQHGEQGQAHLRQRAQESELAARRRAYASDMKLIQQSLADGKLGYAQETLYRHRPRPGETDLRGWEWRYLWQLCQGEAKSALARRDKGFSAVAVSPDGRRIAAALGAHIWNLETNSVETMDVPAWTTQVAFSPREPLLAVVAFRDSTPARGTQVILWHLESRRVVREWTLSASPDSCTGLFFSEDGTTLATSRASEDNEIEIWQVATGNKLRSIKTGPTAGEHRYAFFALTRDLRRAAYVSRKDRQVHVLDLITGRDLWSKEWGADLVTALAFTPDGKTLATGEGSRPAPIRLWDVETGAELGQMDGSLAGVTQFVFWPDGRTLAAAGGDQTIRIWDVEHRRLVRTLRGHTLEVWCLTLLPDNRTLVSGSKNGELLLWDTAAPEPALRATTVIAGEFAVWRFADQGRAVITVDAAGRVTEWRGENFRETRTVLELALKPGLRVWSAEENSMLANPAAHAVLLAADRPRLGYVTDEGTIEVWDWESGGRLGVIAPKETEERVVPLTFSGHGETLWVLRFARGKRMLREEWGLVPARLKRTLRGTEGMMVTLSPDEHRMITLAKNNSLVHFDMESGATTQLQLDLRNGTVRGSFSGDGSLFAVPTGQGLIHIVETNPLRRVTTLSGLLLAAHTATFSPDGRRLATGSDGAEAMVLWDVASHERLVSLPAQAVQFRQAAFSPDGNMLGALAGISPRTTLHFWRAPLPEEVDAGEAKNTTR